MYWRQNLGDEHYCVSKCSRGSNLYPEFSARWCVWSLENTSSATSVLEPSLYSILRIFRSLFKVIFIHGGLISRGINKTSNIMSTWQKIFSPSCFVVKYPTPSAPPPFLKAGDSHEFDVVFVVEDNEKLESDDILKKSCHRNCKSIHIVKFLIIIIIDVGKRKCAIVVFTLLKKLVKVHRTYV